jgi:hypothetical protein
MRVLVTLFILFALSCVWVQYETHDVLHALYLILN